MKMKLALLHQDLGDRFIVKAAKISQIWRTFVPVIAKRLKNFVAWPERRAVRRTFPKCLEKKFFAQIWSNYKHNKTIKYLVGVTPTGLVSFLSFGWVDLYQTSR